MSLAWLPVAVLDSCVLYSAALRDLFMWLANEEVFVPKWTERIHEEWMENVLANRPDLQRERLERTKALMNLKAEGSLVEGYEALISSLTLPDPDDRHVLAAAIVSEAAVIVTFNLSDFPEAALAAYGVEAVHPDEMLVRLLEDKPDAFLVAVEKQVSALVNPPRTWEQHLESLRVQGLPRTAARLAEIRPATSE